MIITWKPTLQGLVSNPCQVWLTGFRTGLLIISAWILIFGISYFWLALSAKPERFYIAIVAACKLAIASIFLTFWFTGDLPLITASAGGGDLFFALIFIYWLFQK